MQDINEIDMLDESDPNNQIIENEQKNKKGNIPESIDIEMGEEEKEEKNEHFYFNKDE